LKVKRVITAFDTHSSGMTSRIVLSGFPEITGRTIEVLQGEPRPPEEGRDA